MTGEPQSFRVHQQEDVVASRKVVATAVVSIAIGLTGVFFAGVVLEATTGSLRSAHSSGTVRSAGRSIANIEQTPILDAKDGLDLREEQRRELSRTQWVDRDAGIAAIPIERAIDLVAGGSR
jgi:hypothetical protein